MKGNLFVISGPSGAGKTEIVKALLKKHPEIGISISCTTRSPRVNEKDGVDYFFITDEEFDRRIAANGFFEWAHVQQNRYGTPVDYVTQQLNAGRDMILTIDVQGCLNVKKIDSTATGIFISPPSGPNLEKRLRSRNTETEESLAVRLGNVAGEVEASRYYDYVVIHYDWNEYPNALETAVDEVYAIITAKRLERSNYDDFLEEFKRSLKTEE